MNRSGHRGKVDANQNAIRDALRDAGAFVRSLAMVGDGCPDLLVGWRGKTILMEVWGPDKKRLTDDEINFQNEWSGDEIFNVRSVEEALQLIK